MPFGRYRAAHALGQFAVEPFLMQLPADAGRLLFVCDLRDSIAREVCFTGRYEPQETQLLGTLLRSGMTVVDAGAHWGYFTMLCARQVGTQGRVLSLEPDPRLMAMLQANVAANGLTQVECIPAAASWASGTAPFLSFRESDGNWGTSRIAASAAGADKEVPTIAIDELVAQRHWNGVDLVKIDVEGAEADVLRGMAQGIRARRYRFVLLECHPAHLAERGLSIADCCAPLRAAGYQGWLIDHSPAMHRRAAVTPVPLADLLRELNDAEAQSEPWPHLFWSAAGWRAS